MSLLAHYSAVTEGDGVPVQDVLRVLYVCDEPLGVPEIAVHVFGPVQGRTRGCGRAGLAENRRRVRGIVRMLRARGWVTWEDDLCALTAAGIAAMRSA